jgi:hypothetical protein
MNDLRLRVPVPLPGTGVSQGGTVVLCDTSSSMGLSASGPGVTGGRTRIELLREALKGLLESYRFIAFDTLAREVPGPNHLPEPAGTTDLASALTYAVPMRPSRVVVISDGEPDSPDEAIAAARALSGTIDTVFCGPDDHGEARAFLKRLARLGGGRSLWSSLEGGANSRLAADVRRLLALPPPGGG